MEIPVSLAVSAQEFRMASSVLPKMLMGSARHYGYLNAVCKGDRCHKEGAQATNWEKVFATHATNKGLVVRIYQEFLEIGKKKIVQWKNGQ